ncbi:MAG: hypothetical protein ACNI27_07425 [Desulfovibrio sp.]
MDCIQEIVTRSGIDHDSARDLLEMVQKEKERLMAEGNIDSIDSQLQKYAQGLGENADEWALRKEKETARNIVRRIAIEERLAEDVQSGAAKNIVQAIEQYLIGSHKGFKNARASVAAKKSDLELRYIGKILAEIEMEKPHLIKVLKKGDNKFLEDVVAEMFVLDDPKLRGKASENPDAAFLAELMADVSNNARLRLNGAGADIRHLKGWVPQRHDIPRIMDRGKVEWKAFLLDNGLLDMERTFGKGASAKFYGETLDEIYENILFGGGVDPVHFDGKTMSGTANLADQLSRKHRKLHFKDAAAWIEYSKNFGAGNVFETIIGHLRQSATDITMLETFGTEPQAFLEQIINRQRGIIRASENLKDKEKSKLLKKLPENLHQANNRIQIAFQLVSGKAYQPANITFAKISANIRGIISMSKLGMAVMSSITDLGTAASRLRNQDVPLLDGYAGMVHGLFEGKLPKEKKEIAYLLGVGFDGVLGDINAYLTAPDQMVSGKIAHMQHVISKISGQSAWTDRMRTSFALMSSAHLAKRAALSYAEISDNLKHNLDLHGIGEAEWAMYQELNLRAADGKEYLVPEAVHDLPDELIDQYIDLEARKAELFLAQDAYSHENSIMLSSVGEDSNNNYFERYFDRLRSNARKELQDKLQRYFIEEADYGVIRPDERTRMYQTAGHKPGAVMGEVMRFMTYFKELPIAFTQRHLHRMWNGGPNGKTDVDGLAHIIASSMVLGYVAMSLKDIAKGREPRDLTDSATWSAALLQGGGAGIYGDFLIGKFSRFRDGPIEAIAGPTFSIGDDILKQVNNAFHGEFDGGDLMYLGMNNTPFVNLWYTRAVLDYAILYRLQEMVSPNYLRRKERNMKKEYGQEFILPPSQVIPRGGF